MFRWLYRGVSLLLLLGLLALNIASLTFDIVNATLSGLIDAFTPSVRASVVADLDRTKVELDRTRADLDRTRVETDDLRRRNADLDADLKRTRADLDTSRRARVDLDADLSRTRQARDAADEAKERLTRELRESREEIAKKSADAVRSMRRIATRMAVNAARNVGSMAAEATPLIGTAAIVGVTTLEVVDACWTIEEVAEVARKFGAEGVGVDAPETLCGYVTAGPDALMSYLLDSVRGSSTAPNRSCEALRAQGIGIATDCAALPPLPPLPADYVPPTIVLPPRPDRPADVVPRSAVPPPPLPPRP